MLTDTLRSRFSSPARNFFAGALAYSVVVFGLLKLHWIEQHAVLPFTQWQGRMAEAALGAPSLPIDVTLACSGADAFALCAGAILAYPATWRLRLGGTAAGFALILVLNSIRIGTLGRMAASPLLFETLHVYVWPAFLILAIAGYVFAWMHLVNARARVGDDGDAHHAGAGLTFTFLKWAAVFVVVFVAASSFYLQSETVLAVAAFIARRGAGALGLLGMEASATGNLLVTSKGVFEVTQECISTPLIPLYLAAVMTYGGAWRRRVLGVAAAIPLFTALGIARLLVVALPAAVIGSPLFLIHAFYQLLLAALVVFGVAAWRRGIGAWRAPLAGCAIGALAAYLLGPLYGGVLSALSIDVPFNDAQGAMRSLPSFQAGLYVALAIAAMTAVAWRAFAIGFAALVVVQVAAISGLLALSRFSDLAPHIRDVRAWAVVAPLAIVVLGLFAHERPRH